MKGETFMCYTLKCGLTKTAVYRTLKEHATSDILLPSLRKCQFKKNKNSYWLFFDNECGQWECNFCQSAGSIALFVFCRQYSERMGGYIYTKASSLRVSPDYLISHGMVRQAA